MDYIKQSIDEIKSDVKKLESNSTNFMVKHAELKKDVDSLHDIVQNHLQWHKEERNRILAYAGITAGVVAGVLDLILRLVIK